MTIQELKRSFSQNRDPERAEKMRGYMKDLFPFLGLPAPLRKELSAPFLNRLRAEKSIDVDSCQALWALTEREYQYVAVDHLMGMKRFLTAEDLTWLGELITTKSWWDTVDLLAASVVGEILKRHPEELSVMDRWNASENIWLIRSSMLFQLKYKEKTDFDRLSRYILPHAESKEFFLQKAAGWALRQHSKLQPEPVKAFLDRHALSPLTVREASRYL